MTEAEADRGVTIGEHRTVSRVMTIIELVLASEPSGLRLAELAPAIDAPKSSVHGLAKGLVATGYLREEGGRYLLGPAIAGLLAAGQTALPAAYRPALEELTQRWGETSLLGSLVGDSIVYVAKVEPSTVIRASPPANKRLALWPRSGGKVFLAHMPPRRTEAFLRRHFSDISERDRVRDELDKIRESGTSINVAGTDGDLIGIATPVIFGALPVNTALIVTGPASRMRDNLEAIATDLRETAGRLSNDSR